MNQKFEMSARRSPDLLSSQASVACEPGPRGAMADEILS